MAAPRPWKPPQSGGGGGCRPLLHLSFAYLFFIRPRRGIWHVVHVLGHFEPLFASYVDLQGLKIFFYSHDLAYKVKYCKYTQNKQTHV